MLKNTFLKTLYEKRWSALIWSLSLFAMVVLVMVLFPTFKESLGESLKDVPDSVKAFLGDAETYQKVTGYLDIQVFAQMVFMTIIFGVILGTGLIAGDEGEGTLQTLLSYPISRTRVYVQKLLALLALTGAVSLVIMAGAYLGVLLVGESVNLVNLFWATFMLWLVTLVFSLLGYALGAITGRRGLAGALAGGLAFVSLLITSLAEGVAALRGVNKLSPFNYFNKPSALEAGLQAGDMLILVIICTVFAVAGYLLFIKRDVYQR